MTNGQRVSPTHHILNVLDKRLLGYSLASSALLLGNDSFAVVQHSGSVNATVLPGNNFTCLFTGASTSCVIRHKSTSGLIEIQTNWGSKCQHAYTNTNWFVKKFDALQTIGSSQTFTAVPAMCNYYFNGLGTKYIGIEIKVFPGPTTHYGWIGITVNTPFPNCIVHDWAWEQIPGLQILAGSTNSLSVALTSFTASMESDVVFLAWTTQSEVDNLGFALERCDMDGEGNLLSDWVEIASYLTHDELKGQGNTSEATDYKFSDPNVEIGRFYGYRIIDVDAAGNRQVHNLIQVEVKSTMPEGMVLLQNFPNPFNPETTIEFSIPETDQITLSVYNLKGQTVDVLVNRELSAGPHNVKWNASDQPAGVYFYELRTGSHREIRKLTLIK